jgi:hypothetical protein
MWFLTVQAVPKQNVLTTEDFGGAAVQCWVNFPSLDGAEQLVNYYLDQEGWVVTNVEYTAWIQSEQYKPENEGYKYALEAEKDGSSFLIQTY